ncbi:MAG: hypothetical protein Q8N60_03325 [Candidatus Diapherotrites archaeon]|nr:hypothetical protein [Candidatus Diapherotrites archaeon]
MNKKAILLFAICILVTGYACASTVSRSFSSTTVQPSADLTVTLTIDITGIETFYAIDELVPSGWTVKDAGTGSAEHKGHVKWVVIQGAKNTALTYTLTAPSEPGTATFAGTCMFEGMPGEIQIAGQTQVGVGATGGSTDLVAPLIALVAIIAIVAIAVKRKK